MISKPNLPLAFSPPRIYILDPVWDDHQAARRAEGICAALPKAVVHRIGYEDLPAVVVEEGWDRFPTMGTMDRVPDPIPLLGVFRFDDDAVERDARDMAESYRGDGGFSWRLAAGGGAFIWFCSGLKELKLNPQHICRPQWRIHQGRGCPHQCAYCGLGGVLLSHINTEVYIEHLARLIDQNPWQKTYLYDDVMDVLTTEPEWDCIPPLMRFFESTKDRYLILHTKSDRVDGLIEAGAPHNTIIAWSLSGPTQSTQLEPRSGSTDARIEAARRCQESGMTVRYKFKPIVPVKNWREEASYTIETALRRSRPDNLSMTVLMWMNVDKLKACIKPEMLDGEFLAAAEGAAEQMHDSRVGPFPDDVRETIYRYYLDEIRKHDPNMPVTISTESLSMWQRLGDELGVNPANYTCGCGAGATPGRKQLDSNPWQDAQTARSWDGRSVSEHPALWER